MTDHKCSRLLPLVLLMAISAHAQNRKSIPIVPRADAICEKLSALADAYNKEHPDDKAQALCALSFQVNPKGSHEVRYPLTPTEIDRLDYLRVLSEIAYHDEDRYEKLLLRRHGHPALPFSDPNWHFIGIKLGDNFITEDVPNK